MLLAKVMLVIGLLLNGYAASEYSQDLQNEKTNPYMDELLSVLSEANGHELFYFSELDTVAARYNFSLPKYTHACLDSYNGLKISPANNDWLNELNATYSILSNWRTFLIDAKTKVLPETAAFLQDVDAQIEYLMKWLDTFGYAFQYREQRNKAKMDAIQAAVIQIALKYKRLYIGAQIDLEYSLCIGQTLRWLNRDTKYTLHSSFTSFTDVVGFDIDSVLEGNYYLSKMPFHQAKKIFSFIAYELNMPVQEYVAVCAETMSKMRITSEEMEEMQTLSQLFGREWGKNNYTSTDELIEKLINDGSPFIRFATKRREFVMSRSHQLLNVTQLFLKKMDADLHDSLLKMNNRAASGASYSDHTIKLFSESTRSAYFTQKRALGRDLERVYGSDFFFQSFFKSSAGLDAVFHLRW